MSTHLARLAALLREQGFPVRIWDEDPGLLPRPAGVMRIRHRQFAWRLPFLGGLVHLHTHHWLTLGLLPLYRLLGCRLLLTLHGRYVPDQLALGGVWALWLRLGLNLQPVLVCVGPVVRETLLKQRVVRPRLEVIPSYLPPSVAGEPPPGEVAEFIRNAPGPLLVVNGTVRFSEGRDLYALDQVLDMLPLLWNKMPDARLLLYYYGLDHLQPEETHYLQSQRTRLERQPYANGVLLHHSVGEEFWPVLRKARLMLRPTREDGFGVSIIEAFAAGVPVVANGRAPRPEGCVLHRDLDAEDFARAVLEALNWPDQRRQALAEHELVRQDNLGPLLRLYREISGRRAAW